MSSTELLVIVERRVHESESNKKKKEKKGKRRVKPLSMLVYSVERVLRSCEQYVFESFWHTDREYTDSPSPVANMFNSRRRYLLAFLRPRFPVPLSFSTCSIHPPTNWSILCVSINQYYFLPCLFFDLTFFFIMCVSRFRCLSL